MLFVVLIGDACSKDKVRGCTDPDSITYNSNAEEDDNSCLYEGSIVFWYGQNISTFLQLDGAISLTYYVNGVIVGSSATNVYWNTAPNCDQGGSVTHTASLGHNKTKTTTYAIKDQTGFTYWSGTVDYEANSCVKYELSDKKGK